MVATPEQVLRTLIQRALQAPKDLPPDHQDAALVQLRPLANAGALTIRLLGQNEDRVDLAVTSQGAEWRVVFFVQPGEEPSAVAVYEKPHRFDGLPGGQIIVLNGPSGSGKSSVMAAVLAVAKSPWVTFDEPWLGETQQPYLIWRDAAPVLHEGYLLGIAALARAGNQVLLSAAHYGPEAIAEAFDGIPTLVIGLDTPVEVLLERERGRPGRWGGLAHATLGTHKGWTYDLRFDTSTTSSMTIAKELLTRCGWTSSSADGTPRLPE